MHRRTQGIGHAVLPLQIVDGIDVPGRGDEITAEGVGPAVDLGEIGHRAAGVPGRRLRGDLHAMPVEDLVVAQSVADHDGRRQRVPYA